MRPRRQPAPAAPTPAAPADAAPAAHVATTTGAAPAAPVTPIPPIGAGTVPVRVISASHGHAVDSVVDVPADQLDAAVAAGWADPSPEAVAEAARLAKLHRDNQGFEKRFDFNRHSR